MRSIIAGAHPAIAEGIKWNSPRFYFREWFATVTIRKDVVYVILHRGAKVRDNSTARPTIDDPTGLLNWFANDRAVVRFSDMQ